MRTEPQGGKIDPEHEFGGRKSKYIWRWTVYSWVCVALGGMVILLGLTFAGSVVPWLIFAVSIAVLGGIGFGFVPRAALENKTSNGHDSSPTNGSTAH